ncbi:uncharacterized protein LOC118424342 [Branchiostoma floridae]|uniref:Uncharacterized protein LOC118424342 n=1 Tax=Branchiostoma floridae TaxID=7739 RepID=A0A9J7LV87_BRAFL|nr:uncharacterized protein LOC118424342 [Branchiostoma floridae]
MYFLPSTVSDEWKQVATHENGLPYNPLGSPMFVAPRPTDQHAINLMCSFIQEKPLLPNVEHDDEDVTTPNWDRLYADRSEDVNECCEKEGDEQELCIEKLRQKNVDQYCYFWAHSMEDALGLHEPCCEEAGEARVQCIDQARYGFDSDIHETDRTIEMMHVPLMQTLKRLSKQGISRPAPFDHKFCTWAKQQPDLTTPFDEATLQRMDPIQKNSEATRTLTSCCYISDDEPTIDQCMSSVREKVLDELCWEQEVVETGLPLIDASVVSEFPAGLNTIMSYKDDIPAHPCCHKSHTNRYSCFSQEWFGFEAHRDTYDHTAEIAQYKEKFAQLESKIVALAQEMGQTEICEFCKRTVFDVYGMLRKNATEEDIIEYLNQKCSQLPSGLRGQCTTIVKESGSDIIKMLMDGVHPDFICEEIKLCVSSNAARLAKGGHSKRACDKWYGGTVLP